MMTGLQIFMLLAMVMMATQAFSPLRNLASGNKKIEIQRVSNPQLTKTLLSAEKGSDGTEYWQGDWVCADCGYVSIYLFDFLTTILNFNFITCRCMIA